MLPLLMVVAYVYLFVRDHTHDFSHGFTCVCGKNRDEVLIAEDPYNIV